MKRSDFDKDFDKEEDMKSEWYSGRSLLGHDAIFYVTLGAREAGKSYFFTDFCVRQWRKYGRPFYWMRLTETSAAKLLTNNAEKLIDPDLRRKYKLDLVTRGDAVYEVLKRGKDNKVVEKRQMCRVMCLSTFYNDKGSGLFDKDFLNNELMYYNIVCDEFEKEKNERSQGDLLYQFTNQLENLVRSTKQRIRVILIGNTLEECSDILARGFNFLPEEYGRYKLKKKRCVIDYIAPSKKYLTRRKGTIADILMPDASTFTNEIHTDESLISKARLIKPVSVIKFEKSKDKIFTIWNDNIISEYNGERAPIISMRPYLDSIFNTKLRDSVILQFDTRCFKFRNLVTFKKFQNEIRLLKPRK